MYYPPHLALNNLVVSLQNQSHSSFGVGYRLFWQSVANVNLGPVVIDEVAEVELGEGGI